MTPSLPKSIPFLSLPSCQQHSESAMTGRKEVSIAYLGHEETRSENGFLLSFENPRQREKKMRQVDDLDKQLWEDKIVFAEGEKMMEDNLHMQQ